MVPGSRVHGSSSLGLLVSSVVYGTRLMLGIEVIGSMAAVAATWAAAVASSAVTPLASAWSKEANATA